MHELVGSIYDNKNKYKRGKNANKGGLKSLLFPKDQHYGIVFESLASSMAQIPTHTNFEMQDYTNNSTHINVTSSAYGKYVCYHFLPDFSG